MARRRIENKEVQLKKIATSNENSATRLDGSAWRIERLTDQLAAYGAPSEIISGYVAEIESIRKETKLQTVNVGKLRTEAKRRVERTPESS